MPAFPKQPIRVLPTNVQIWGASPPSLEFYPGLLLAFYECLSPSLPEGCGKSSAFPEIPPGPFPLSPDQIRPPRARRDLVQILIIVKILFCVWLFSNLGFIIFFYPLVNPLTNKEQKGNKPLIWEVLLRFGRRKI